MIKAQLHISIANDYILVPRRSGFFILTILLSISFFSTSNLVLGQENLPELNLLTQNYSLEGLPLLILKNRLDNPVEIKYPAFYHLKVNTEKQSPSYSSSIPASFQYEDLAIFCKIEYKMEKKLKFPLKVRLGEVNYAERREGKPASSFNEEF